VSFEQLKREVAMLDERQQAELISYTLQLREQEKTGSARGVRQAMHRSPHLASADVDVLEAAMERGKLPVSEPWTFNDRK
jgi:hypothetical protein